MKITTLLLVIGLIGLLFISGCVSKKIAEIKNEKYIGETVSVYGTVKTTIKIGPLSGYTVEDDTGTIGVSSEELPEEGVKKRVGGVLMKDTLFGYYIKPQN